MIEDEEVKAPDRSFYVDLVIPKSVPTGIEPVVGALIPEKPTFGETLKANFQNYNLPYRAGKAVSEHVSKLGGMIDRKFIDEESYAPFTQGLTDGIQPKDIPIILAQPSYKDGLIKRNNILKEYENKDIANRSGTLANLVTTGFAATLSPDFLIPFASTIKYGQVSKGIFANMYNTAKTMGPVVALQNAALVSTKETEGLEEWAYDSLFESMMVSGIGGILGGFAAKMSAKDLAAGKAYFDVIKNEAEIKYAINPDGSQGKILVKPLPGSTVSAAAIENIELALNAGTVNFKDNKMIRTMFGWGSPVIRGLTSKYEVVNRVTAGLFPNNFELTKHKIGGASVITPEYILKQKTAIDIEASRIIDTEAVGLAEAEIFIAKQNNAPNVAELETALKNKLEISKQAELNVERLSKQLEEEIASSGKKAELASAEIRANYIQGHDAFTQVKAWQGANEWLNIFEYQMWLDFIGAKGPVKGMEANLGSWTGKYISQEEFSTMVAIDYRRGGVSDVPQVKAVSQMRKKELFDPLLEELQKEYPHIKAHEFTNIVSHLSRIYDKKKIATDPTSFIADVEEYITKNNNKLIEMNAPFEEAQKRIDKSKSAFKEHKQGKAKLQQEVKTLKEKKAQLKQSLVDARQERAKQKQVNATERERITQERTAPLQLAIEEKQKHLAKIDEKIAKIHNKISKLTDINRIEKLKGYQLSMAEADRAIAHSDIVAAKDELAALRKAISEEPKAPKVSTDKIDAIKKEISETNAAINKSRQAFREDAELLQMIIASEEEALEKLHQDLNEKIKLGDIERDLLVGAPSLTGEEALIIDELNKEVTATRNAVREIQSELTRSRKIKGAEGILKRNELREKLKVAKEKAKLARQDVNLKIEAGQIHKDLLHETPSGFKVLKSTSNIPELRKVLTPDQIKNTSEGVKNKIMQMNPEQVLGEIFQGITEGGNDIFMSRTLLWNDAYAEKWLVNDMRVIGGAFTDQAAKRLHMDRFLKDFGVDQKKGMEGIVHRLKESFNEFEAELLEQPKTAKRDKELLKLNKEFEKEKKYLGDLYKLYMGNYADKTSTAYKVTDGIKKLATATLLGNTPLVQLTDFFTPLFRLGMKEYVQDGLTQTVNRMRRTEKLLIENGGDAYIAYSRGAYADIQVGVNRWVGNKIQEMSGYHIDYNPKTVPERAIDNMATWSQQFSGANLVADATEIMTAATYESSLIRTLKRWQAGEKLLTEEIDLLDRARINPHKWADSMLAEYGTHGKPDGEGFSPNFHLWKDQSAARQFKMSVSKLTREVQLRADTLDKPLIMNDPFMSMMTQFTSYAFAATNKFTVPLITEFDNRKLFGTIMMMGMGAWIGVLRSLVKGEEPDLSLGALTSEALTNSSFMGANWEALMRLNAAIDAPPLQFLQASRMKSKALSIGPAAGLYEMGSSVIDSLIHGEMNQKDAAKALRLFSAGSYNWYTAPLIRTALNASGLPETRQEAKRRNE